MRVAAVLAIVALSITAVSARAQNLSNFDRFDGTIIEVDYDLATGTISNPMEGPESAPAVVYSNVTGNGSFYRPQPGFKVMDWGNITTSGYDCITAFQIGYATSAMAPISMNISFTTGGVGTLGYGTMGTTVVSFALGGLPGSPDGVAIVAYTVNVNLSSADATFNLPDGDVGYLYEMLDTLSGPLLVGPPNEAGVANAFDKYDLTNTLVGTFWFGGTPMASFHMEITGHKSFADFGSSCPGAGGYSPLITMSGCACPGEVISLDLTDCEGGAFAVLAFDTNLGSTTLPSGCTIDIGWPPAKLILLGYLSGVGAGAGGLSTSAALPMPAGPLLELHMQALVKDSTAGVITSNGVTIGIAP
ncbi:MAG: hypothetical protein V2A76_16715 [Planctomycetota bacterium]